MVFFAIGIFTLIYAIVFEEENLPVYNPTDFNPELVDASLRNTESHHTVAAFELATSLLGFKLRRRALRR